MEVTLIFPPQWTPTQPYLGTASLAAYLKEQGFQCQQVDLNAAFYDFILQKPLIEKSYHAIRETITGLEKKDHLSPEEKELYKKTAPLSALGDYILNTMVESIHFMKSRKCLSDIGLYAFHQGIVNYALHWLQTLITLLILGLIWAISKFFRKIQGSSNVC
jgi:anaerobic magnesium-protoporphyrin IX monomethyl ester cyclase